MATLLFSQRLRPSVISSDSTAFVCKACRRNAASYRRTRKALRVKTDPSFEPSEGETQDHIIFNPPPSIPNVYHTPAKFLPKSDPRRAIYTSAAEGLETVGKEPAASSGVLAAIAAQHSSTEKTPPPKSLKPIKPIHEKKYHLREEQVEEIRRLRAEDPKYWTRYRVAQKFDCSIFFVTLCCSTGSKEGAKKAQSELEEIKAKWGRRKREARDARLERQKLWGRDA